MRLYDDDSYRQVDKLRVVQGAVEKAGANIRTSQRVGHEHRDKTIAHLNQMADLGYLDGEEAETRKKIAADATTETELRHLTGDLPGLVVHKKWDWDNPVYWVPTLIMACVASITVGIMPTAVLASVHAGNTPWGIAVSAMTIVGGILGLIASIVGIVIKVED